MRICFKLAAVCCVFCVAGCQQDDEWRAESEELLMSIEASIGSSDAKGMSGRYVSGDDDGVTSLSFDEGDKIGVFVNGQSLTTWENGAGGWSSTPTTYWPDKTNSHRFYAFYPNTEATANATMEKVPMPSLAAQTGNINNLDNYDFLKAYKMQAYEEGETVSFTGANAFQHVSSLVTVTIAGTGDLAESTIKSISFAGDNVASSTYYSFTDKRVNLVEGGSVNEMTANLSKEMSGEDKTFYFILNAGVALSGVTFSISYQTDDKNYTASKRGLGNATLESGKQYNFNLVITDGVLSISGADIKDWADGGAMDDIVINGTES